MEWFLKTWYGIVAFALFDTLAFFAIVCITYRWWFKRIFDFLFAIPCLIAVSPILLVIVIRGKIAKKRGEIERLVHTDEFVCKKGRVKDLHIFAYRTADGEIAGKYGAWLLRTRLYQLLRLWDIFLGRLSFIGPRLYTESDCERLTDEEMDRFLCRPGLISPVLPRETDKSDEAETLRADCKYAWEYSFFKDCNIFFSWLLSKIRS